MLCSDHHPYAPPQTLIRKYFYNLQQIIHNDSANIQFMCKWLLFHTLSQILWIHFEAIDVPCGEKYKSESVIFWPVPVKKCMFSLLEQIWHIFFVGGDKKGIRNAEWRTWCHLWPSFICALFFCVCVSESQNKSSSISRVLPDTACETIEKVKGEEWNKGNITAYRKTHSMAPYDPGISISILIQECAILRKKNKIPHDPLNLSNLW